MYSFANRLFAADGIFDDSIPVKVKICSENKSEATKETTLTGDEAYLHKAKGEAIIEASFEKIEFGKFKRDKDVSVCESRYQLIFTTSLCCLGLEFQLQVGYTGLHAHLLKQGSILRILEYISFQALNF